MRSTALVLIEYQNDSTSEGDALHEAVKLVMQSTGMLGHTVATCKTCPRTRRHDYLFANKLYA